MDVEGSSTVTEAILDFRQANASGGSLGYFWIGPATLRVVRTHDDLDSSGTDKQHAKMFADFIKGKTNKAWANNKSTGCLSVERDPRGGVRVSCCGPAGGDGPAWTLGPLPQKGAMEDFLVWMSQRDHGPMSTIEKRRRARRRKPYEDPNGRR
jgi:hypothetical protein